MFNISDVDLDRNYEEVIAEIMYYYLFEGYSLTSIEKIVFNTFEYHGWISKVLLNINGIDTSGKNKGIYSRKEVEQVVSELKKSNNKKYFKVAQILQNRYL